MKKGAVGSFGDVVCKNKSAMEHGASYAYMHLQLTIAAADARSGGVS